MYVDLEVAGFGTSLCSQSFCSSISFEEIGHVPLLSRSCGASTGLMGLHAGSLVTVPVGSGSLLQVGLATV